MARERREQDFLGWIGRTFLLGAFPFCALRWVKMRGFFMIPKGMLLCLMVVVVEVEIESLVLLACGDYCCIEEV